MKISSLLCQGFEKILKLHLKETNPYCKDVRIYNINISIIYILSRAMSKSSSTLSMKIQSRNPWWHLRYLSIQNNAHNLEVKNQTLCMRDATTAKGNKMVGVKKAAWSTYRAGKLNQSRVGGFSTRYTINPGGFAMGFLRSWSEMRGGVAVGAAVWFISNRFSRNRDNSPALNFYFSPRSPCSSTPLPFSPHPSLFHHHHCHPCSLCFFIVIATILV